MPTDSVVLLCKSIIFQAPNAYGNFLKDIQDTMNTLAEKKSENKHQSVANSLQKTRINNEMDFRYVDHRPEVITQRKLQETVNNSPRVRQLKNFQKMATDSSKVANQGDYKTIQREININDKLVTDRLNVAGENHAQDSEHADKQIMFNSGLDVSKYFTETEFKYNQARLSDEIPKDYLKKVPPADPILTTVLSNVLSSCELLKESLWIIHVLKGLLNAYNAKNTKKWDKWEISLKYNDTLKKLIATLDIAYLSLFDITSIEDVRDLESAERKVDGGGKDGEKIVKKMLKIPTYEECVKIAFTFDAEKKAEISALGLRNQLTELENDDRDESWLHTGTKITSTDDRDLIEEMDLLAEEVQLNYEFATLFEKDFTRLYKQLSGEIPPFGETEEKTEEDKVDTERSRYMHEAANENVTVKGLWKIGEYHVQDILKTPGITNYYNLIPRSLYKKILPGKKLPLNDGKHGDLLYRTISDHTESEY